MSERERMVTLLETIDDVTISEILDMTLLLLAKRKRNAEDARDIAIYEEYLKDPEAMEFMPIEECAKELGVTLRGDDDGKI